MDTKSMIFFLLTIGQILYGTWAIQVYPDPHYNKELPRLEVQRIRDDVNSVDGSSRTVSPSDESTENENQSSSSRELNEEPPDHEIPYSEHENPREVSTQPRYVAPGDWAKPPKEKDIPLDFVPTKVYAQVRGTHTVKHAPREEAIQEAETDEEKLNALRLREVVKNSKINTVYTEEGYEDSAYDHAGHIRDADFHEGFARKLRDRLKEKRAEEKGNSGELANYEDDYDDRDGNDEENSRDNHLESNLNPKSIVQNEIGALVEDVEKNIDKAEESSDIHLFDSKKLKGIKDTETKSDYGNDRIRYETTTYEPVEERNTDRSIETIQSDELNHYDQDNPTTIAYGQIVWDFLKTKKPEAVESVTLSPYTFQPTPIATTTLTLPEPYFLPAQQETTTLPSVFLASQTYHPRGLDSDLVNAGLIASISQNNEQVWPMQTSSVNYLGRIDNSPISLTPSSISNSEETWKPFLQSTPDYTVLHNYGDVNEQATTILPRDEDENISKIEETSSDSYDNNDDSFTSPLLRNTSGSVNQKKKYRVLVRYKPEKSTTASKSHRSHKQYNIRKLPDATVQHDEFINDQRAKYLKVLNYVTNQDRARGSNDFAVARAPIASGLKEVRYFDFHGDDRPAGIDQPSVPIESETIIMRESNVNKKLPRNRPISNVDGFLGTSSLPIYELDAFPLLDLAPPPLPSSRYRKPYRPISPPYKKNRHYRDIEPLLKYAPVIVDLTRKSQERRKRSTEYVKGERRNNATTNRETGKLHYDKTAAVTKDGKRSSRIAEESYDGEFRESDYGKRIDKKILGSRRSRKTHEELLNDSPKVSGDVVDKEIEERFNKDVDKTDKKSEDSKDVNVEVEVPSFDYVEEFANQREEDHSTTTEITPDFKKYPFYVNERIEDLSGLKYAIDPKKVPRKTATGMEFYDSRDRYKNCEEIEANLDEIPPKEEKPSADRGPNENGPRLRGLGDKLDCFKAKYFDENPFDNPLFIEKNVGDPSLPKELDPKRLSNRILVLPAASGEFIFQKLSRKPEQQNINSRKYQRKYKDREIEKNRDPARPYGARTSRGYQRVPNKRRRKERVSSFPNSPTEPYHKHVYEDVMNHIKGSNDPYRIYRTTTIKPISHIEVAADTANVNILNGHLNEIINQTASADNGTEIAGLLPPKGPNDFVRQNDSGRKVIVRKSRRRSPRYHVPKTIARYHAIKIQKRSIEKPKVDDLLAEESETIPVTVKRRRRKFSVATQNLTTSTETNLAEDPAKEPSSKIIYTIRDRIRHSKPKDELKGVGKFTTVPSTSDEDSRRKEPRYDSVNGGPSESDSSTVPTILSTIWTDKSTIKESTTPNTIFNKRLRYSTVSRDRSKKIPEDNSTRASSKYEVHESIEDEIVTTPVPIISTSLEYARVMEYLDSDPPGYKEAFSEERTEFPVVQETRSEEPSDRLKETSEENEEENSNESAERPYESKEDISEKKENDEEDGEDDEEGEEESRESSEESKKSKEEEDRTFFHFSSRPYSPPENFDDEKYSDLGKRINKPAFYHPPFSMLGYESSRLSRLEESSEEEDEDEDEEDSDENNKKKTRFALHSWSDEKDGDEKSFGESKYYSRPFWSYEYPWEKRERLASGERGKGSERSGRSGGKSYGRFGDFRSKDSNEDVSSSKHRGSRLYPWDLYDVPSRKNEKSRRGRYFDTDGSGSENKPVKYSSKYNSSLRGSISGLNNSNRLPIDPEKIIKKGLIQSGSSKENSKPSNVRRVLSGTLVPEVITSSPIKDPEGKEKFDERNSTEVTTVATIEQKKRKNVARKEPRNEEANSTTQSPTSTESANKLSITNRPTDGSRRRRILKKYSMNNIDKDNSTEHNVQIKRRRGKIRSTTVAPPSATTTIVSSTIPTRRRFYSRTRGSDGNLSKSKELTATPSTTTVEHRSRFSKESFVSRTTYPDNENSTVDTDDGSKTFGQNYRDKDDEIDRNRGNVTSENIERISVMTKETPDHVYRTKKIDKDGVKEMFVSIMPNKAGNVSELESDSTEFEDEEERWKIPNEESEDLGDVTPTESYLVGNLLETHPRNDRKFEDESAKLEGDEDEERSEIKSSIKFIREPERRLYYYVERRR